MGERDHGDDKYSINAPLSCWKLSRTASEADATGKESSSHGGRAGGGARSCQGLPVGRLQGDGYDPDRVRGKRLPGMDGDP